MMDHSYWKDGNSVNINGEPCGLTKGERKFLMIVDICFVASLVFLAVATPLAYNFDIPWLNWLAETPFK